MNTSARRHPIVCPLALAAGLVLSGCRTGDGPVQAPGSASVVARRLAELEARPHVYPPQTIAGDPAVFQFALLDTKGVQPNIFNSKIAGVNDTDPFGTAGPDSIGLVRLVVLARPGLSSDPADPRTPIGVYLDIAGLQPAMAESGVYELFALYNTMVPPSAEPRADGQAQYGTITPDDAKALSQMGGQQCAWQYFHAGRQRPPLLLAGRSLAWQRHQCDHLPRQRRDLQLAGLW